MKPKIDERLEQQLKLMREGLLTKSQIRKLFQEVQEPLAFKSRKKPRGRSPEYLARQYKTKGDEPISEKMSLRLTPSMKRRLDAIAEKQAFVRDAIAEKLDKEDP